MDENLQRLTEELRAERCPRRVLENVASRIARRPRPIHQFLFRGLGFAGCVAALLTILAVWHRPNRVPEGPSQAVIRSQADQVRVAEEAGMALSYIGNVLMEAGEHTENILLDEAFPPLRNGFEAATKSIKNRL